MSAFQDFEFKGKLYRATWPKHRLRDGREIIATLVTAIGHRPSSKEGLAALKSFRRRQDKQAGHA